LAILECARRELNSSPGVYRVPQATELLDLLLAHAPQMSKALADRDPDSLALVGRWTRAIEWVQREGSP